jgi:two-component system alkaline phosphatase synthesis response regulator PhoP
MLTILIIEDETRIAHWVREYFEQGGFRALIASDGPTGLQLARSERPDLIILDLMLPGMDGRDICRAVRRESDVPIIMLTARTKEMDRILGLELGADDYVIKPFSPGELVARARAVLRRAHGEVRQPEILQGANIRLDLAAYSCTIDGDPVDLSRIQFQLLTVLMQNKGRALSRQQLLEAVFEGDYDGFDRTIDVHIRRLRKRVEADPANPRHIVTVFGVGYKFVE